MYPQHTLVRITAQYRGLYKIVTEHGEVQAEISGKFCYETTELAKFPTVGDFVMASVDVSGGSAGKGFAVVAGEARGSLCLIMANIDRGREAPTQGKHRETR